MGKFKVSFTTALFVFSFLICVIVAVAFVDRTPQNDYDSFYDGDRATGGSDTDKRRKSGTDDWDSHKAASASEKPAASNPAPSVEDPNLAELPIDPQLAGSVQEVSVSPAPAATANPMQGRSPEEISRALLGQVGINASIEAAVPGMAVPPGIATPRAAQQQAVAPAPGHTAPAFLPLQSNTQQGAPGPGVGTVPPPAPGYQGMGNNIVSKGSGLLAPPSLGGHSNAANKWNPVAAKSTPQSMLGVRSAPSNPSDGMMISRGQSATGAAPPPGFENGITQDGTATPMPSGSPSASSSASGVPQTGASPTPGGFGTRPPGGLDQPLLLAPQPESGSNKFDLPPAPTLRPPPIQDPDRRRSDADPGSPDANAPDSMNPDGSSGQALPVSGDSETAAAPADDPDIAAQVNEKILSADKALRLAEVNFVLKDQTLTSENRKSEAKKAAAEWEEITLAAEVARQRGLTVNAPDLERYAAMRPDFDPAAWQSAMAEKGFSEKEIRENLTNIALSEKLVEQDFDKEVTPEKIRQAYDKKPSRYATERKVHLLEIFKQKPEDEKRAEKVASEMRRLQQQAAGGTDFGLLARQASQASDRSKGGNMGWITPAKDPDEDRDKAIADLKPGEVSKVLEEPTGYRIYKLTDVTEATSDFEGGKDLVVAELKTPVRKASFSHSRENLAAGPAPRADVKTAMVPKKTAPGTDGNEKIIAPAAKATPAAESGKDAEAAARHAKAQEVLAAAANRRHAAEKQQISGAMPQEQGVASQVQYPPGSQVQQMDGGQPAPPYQPGGQLAPLQSSMNAPDSVKVKYGPGQNMQMPVTASNFRSGPAPVSLNATDNGLPAQGSGPMTAEAAAMPAPGMQADGTMAPQAAAPGPTPIPDSISNGWRVNKTIRTPEPAGSKAAAAASEPPARADAGPAPGDVPPGFEGSSSGSSAAAAQPAHKSKGVVGSVKSFFVGLKKYR